VTPTELAAQFRSHSRLTGVLADNLEGWLREPGTLRRYLDLVPRPLAGETHLVDIGCYQPTIGYYFGLGWKEVKGIFKDDGEGTVADAYGDDQGARVEFVMRDIETEPLPVADGWADAVIMMQVWEHFAVDPMHVLWEINRILKPGGRLILSTPNGACWRYAMRVAQGSAAWDGMEFTGFSTNRHNRLYDAIELPRILAQAGFAVSNCTTRDFGAYPVTGRERVFKAALTVFDGLFAMLSGRRNERDITLFAQATKQGAPLERFPDTLYFRDQDWPGISAERDRLVGPKAAK
jgi:SAM-dependent methyltransferase